MAQQEFDIMKPISADLDIGTTMFDTPADVSKEQVAVPVSESDIWNMAPPPFPGEQQKAVPVTSNVVPATQEIKEHPQTNVNFSQPVYQPHSLGHLDMGYLTEAEAQLFSDMNNDGTFSVLQSSDNTVLPVISQPTESEDIPEEVRLALQQEQIDKSEEWFPNVRVRVNGVEVHGKKKNASFVFLFIFLAVFIGIIVFVLALN